MGPAKPLSRPAATPATNTSVSKPPASKPPLPSPPSPSPPAAPAPDHARLAAEQAALKRELSRVYAEACGCKRRDER